MTYVYKPLPLIRNSERNDFKACPAKHNWRWNQGLVPATPRQDARWFGSIWHVLWATVYTPPEGKDGFTRAITKPEEIHALWDELSKDSYTTVSSSGYFDEDKEREYWDAIKLGHFMIDGQLNRWKLDPGYEVLMPEQRFRMKIPFNKRQQRVSLSHWVALGHTGGPNRGGHIVEVVGTFDLPIRDHYDGRGHVWILDWKSTNRKDNLKQANKDDQMGLYSSVAQAFLRSRGMIGKSDEVKGAIWSFARKAMPPDPATVDEEGRIRNKPQKKHYIAAILGIAVDDLEQLSQEQNDAAADLQKFSLEKLAAHVHKDIKVWGDVAKRQGGPLFWREPIVRNKANKARQMARIADDAEMIQLARQGIIPVTKSPGDHCNWCDFNDLCDIDEDGGDTQDFIDNVFKYEDPYADHQAGADNSKVRK